MKNMKQKSTGGNRSVADADRNATEISRKKVKFAEKQ